MASLPLKASGTLTKSSLLLRVVLRSGYTISLIWGEKRCVSDMFDINVFVLQVSGIVCFQSFVASNICELFLWQDKAVFFGEDILLTECYIGCHSVGENMECYLFLSTIMFLYCRQLKVLTPQIWRHHVFRFTFYNMSNFMFSERTYFDGTPTSKIWLRGTEKLKRQLQSFYPKCLELGWEFINKIPLIILFIKF